MLLAAGGSCRLGRPKQLLQYRGNSLLKHSLNAAAGAGTGKLVVVLGARANLLQKEIDETGVEVVINEEWQKGMASSLVTGLDTLIKKYPGTGAVIIMTCDQPFVSAWLLRQLITTQQQTGKLIVTSDYGKAIGPPSLFHKDLFKELLTLEGDKGARMLVQQHTSETASIPFPLGDIDIDTLEDYGALLQENNDKQ